MSDDLVTRLHAVQRPDFPDAIGSLANEAADRIEADHRLIVQKQQHVKEQETELVELRCTGGDLRRRIEALEAIIAENVAQDGQPIMERMAAQRTRISELETRIIGLEAMLVDGSKREQDLEAALREIVDCNFTLTRNQSYVHVMQARARRALEGKP